ncbi:MAG: class I SAM-dependent RNA methyltransferase [Actinomycetota bacterium]
MPEIEVRPDRVATGGSALGRADDGRVVFVAGALPGEHVRARIVTEHARRLDAVAVEVLDPAPGRRTAPCPHVAEGCGGCDWQHVAPATQRELRRDIVVDCLRRLGRVDDPDVRLGPELPAGHYRTTVRAAVVDGRAGFRKAASHDVVLVDSCATAHPLVDEVLVAGRFGSASEVTVRAGANTGERLVLVDPTADGVAVPGNVTVVGADALAAGHGAHYHERIGTQTLRVSASSFFQCRADGAEVLVDLVSTALEPASGRLLDAYCGVGLFAATLTGFDEVTGVEGNRRAVDDARVNLGDRGRVIKASMERWRPEPADAIVADPSRSGLGRDVVGRLSATGASVLALVSCDPASLARDAALLAAEGFRLDHVTTVDLFGETSHVETVSRFVR